MSGIEFEVDEDVEVLGPNGSTQTGWVRPGTIYQADGRSGGWLIMRDPNGEPGYVAENRTRTVTTAAVAPTAPPPAAASPPARGRQPVPAGPTQGESRPSGRRWVFVAAALVLALGAAAVAVTLTQGGDDGGDTTTYRAEGYVIDGRQLRSTFVLVRDDELVSYRIVYSDEEWCGGGVEVPGFAEGDEDRVVWEDGVLTGEVLQHGLIYCDPAALDLESFLVRPDLRVQGDSLVGTVEIVSEETGDLVYSFEVGG